MTRLLKPFALSIVLVAVAAPYASAQIGGAIGRRVNNAVERKVNNKIDQKIEEMVNKAVDQSFDAMFGDGSPSADKSGKTPGTPRLFNLLPNAPTEARYDFDATITYNIERFGKNGKSNDKATMLMQFAKNAPFMGVQYTPSKKEKGSGDITVIFDSKNESMVMLMQSEDQKFSMAYGWSDALRYAEAAADTDNAIYAEGADQTVGNVTYKYIGKKKIAGYDAEGYRADDADGTVSEVWVSRDAALTFARMMGATASMKQLRTMPANHPVGMLLEANSTEKNGERTLMTAVKIDPNASVRIDMSEFPQMGKAATEGK